MRITEVTAFALKLPRQPRRVFGPGEVDEFGDYFLDRDARSPLKSHLHETMVVRVVTDQGVVGYGEGESAVLSRASKVIVEDLCRPILMGRDPFDVEVLWHRMYGSMRERGHPTGFLIDALAGCDIALWDIIGKATGQPVHKLIGGRFRDRVEVYAGLVGSDPEAVAAKAQELVSKGYRAMKLSTRSTLKDTVGVVAAVRDSVGPDVGLMVDVHTRFSVAGAIELGRELEKLDVRWLEAPTIPEDIKGQAEIARALDMPVAAGEWSRTRFEMREAFERRAFDIVMPDVGRTGITEGKKIASLADIYNIPVSPHVGGGGILSVVASIHFSASIPNFLILEHSADAHEGKSRLVKDPPQVVDGCLAVGDKPGLGVEVDEAALARFGVS